MRRSTWIAVAITIAVLAGAGLLSRPGAWRAETWRDGVLAVGAALASASAAVADSEIARQAPGRWKAAMAGADALARQVPVPVAAGVTIGGGIALIALGIAFHPRPRNAATSRGERRGGVPRGARGAAGATVEHGAGEPALRRPAHGTARRGGWPGMPRLRIARPGMARRARLARDAVRCRERLGRA